jgi:hypothetical protein
MFIPQLLQTATEESVVPEGMSPDTSLSGITDTSENTDLRYQITQSLEGGMSEILQFEDTVNIMTSVLVSAVKMWFQTGKIGLEKILIETTTNIAKIQKYTEQSFVELLFKVVTKNIVRSGTGCVDISLQKA